MYGQHYRAFFFFIFFFFFLFFLNFFFKSTTLQWDSSQQPLGFSWLLDILKIKKIKDLILKYLVLNILNS